MGVTTTVSDDGSQVTLKVQGRFDFSAHHDFVKAYKEFAKGEKGYVVDLSVTEYMDSSAMGMLLQLREHARRDGVVLANGNEAIQEILRIANFHKLFQVR